MQVNAPCQRLMKAISCLVLYFFQRSNLTFISHSRLVRSVHIVKAFVCVKIMTFSYVQVDVLRASSEKAARVDKRIADDLRAAVQVWVCVCVHVHVWV